MSAQAAQPVFGWGEWEIDTHRRELRSRGVPVPLGGRAFDVMEVLVRAAGQLVTKDDLMAAVWPGLIVEENTLQVQVSALRKALGADRQILQTASGRGYRLGGAWGPRLQSLSPRGLTSDLVIRTGAASRGNLPAVAAELVGRAAAAEQLRRLVGQQRVVTLTGIGGIGKTSLATEVARQLHGLFPDGCWLIELTSLTAADALVSTVAQVLGAALGGGEISPESLARSIGSGKLLLLLDNCEHLIDATARLVEALVGMCPNASVLATSREMLRIVGEHVYRVPPLDVPPEQPADCDALLDHSAVQLFVARVRATHGEFAPTRTTLEAIAAICRHLDGLPLAIEFAAARAAMLGAELVLEHLGERFALLTGGHRTAPQRHQTLRAMLDWSYELLSEAERRLLRRLSIFAASFTAEAAAALVVDTGQSAYTVAEGIGNLAAKSLVAVDGSMPAGRWRLLETIRKYGQEKLAEAGETQAVARWHAQYFRNLLAPAASGSLSHFTLERLAQYRLEIDNVRAALDWAFSDCGDTEIGIALTAAYAPVLLNTDLMRECRERAERALASWLGDPDSNAKLLLRLYMMLGVSMTSTNAPVGKADETLNEALALAVKLSDVQAQLRILWAIWALHLNTGSPRKLRAAADRFQRIAVQCADRFAQLTAERFIGVAQQFSGQLHQARERFERILLGLQGPRESPHTFFGQYDLYILARAMLARTLCAQGLVDEAASQARRSLEEARGRDLKFSQCEVLRLAVGPIALMTGDIAGAERAIAMYRELAAITNAANHHMCVRDFEGRLLVKRGAFHDGFRILRSVMNESECSGWTTSYPEMLAALAEGLAGMKLLDEALAVLDKALAFAEAGGERWYVPELRRLKGELLLGKADEGSSSAAEQSLNEGIELARRQGALLWELRAALTLAGHWQRCGRKSDARGVLAPVCARVPEGSGMLELVRAGELLQAL
jgi:predicted ATPase